MDFKHLYIKYCNPSNNLDSFTLQYQLRDNSIVPKWCERIESAQKKYTIDDPTRFYGFGSKKDQIEKAVTSINNCINVINGFESIIDRQLKTVDDQDTLNYLHHIFEIYHGPLDKQIHELWQRAPIEVRRALAELNILVHRCESIQRQALPRHVVTYYGLPKNKILDDDDYWVFEDTVTFGTVYLNYVEIGKTLDDLAMDNDQYIFDSGFQPFRHYSADFNIKFWNDDPRQVVDNRAKIKHYYDQNSEFFKQKQLPWGHRLLTSGSVPLADLVYSGSKKELLKKLESHQQVAEVILL
jgi:hypothetical protein